MTPWTAGAQEAESEEIMDLSTLRPCPECGGQQRVPVELVGSTEEYGLLLLRQRQRKVPLLSGQNRSPAQLVTCLTCGYTALFALYPDNLSPDPGRP